MFIIEHQTAELWFKLILHELRAAIEHVRHDRLPPCRKILGRVSQIQRQLFNQWSVLETLTPSEYVQFRGVLGHASGFQSLQFRTIEFLLGNKNKDLLRVFDYDASVRDQLARVLHAPSLYDEFLRHLHRLGHAIPNGLVNRDWSEPYEMHTGVVTVFREIYEDTGSHWAAYEMCEKLVDVEESFQLWRFRHMKTVERIIGFKTGTGGSSGVQFLKESLEVSFFPELIAVRTEIRE
jgi:tryptophan 2,3-dioxygenase